MKKLISLIFIFYLIITCSVVHTIELNDKLLEQEHQINKKIFTKTEQNLRYSECIENCYENSTNRVPTFEACMQYDDCTECIDNCMNEFDIHGYEAITIAKDTFNLCFINSI